MAITEARVQPEQLLKDLRNLWGELAKKDENGVLRACAMTFIVAVRDEPEAVQNVSETIALLMHEHPSRAIEFVYRMATPPLLRPRCWPSAGCPSAAVSRSAANRLKSPVLMQRWPICLP